jgi:prepilin-type processing-associated H-X9-DG protein
MTSYAFCVGTIGPSNKTGHATKYGNNGMFIYVVKRKLREITDGTTKTMMVGEAIHDQNTWCIAGRHRNSLRSTENALNTPDGLGFPNGNNVYNGSNGAFSSDHPGGGQFVYGDGRVEIVTDFIDFTVYQGQSTISRGDLAN